MSQHTRFSVVDATRTRACQALHVLLQRGFSHANSQAAFDEVHRLLEALPLASEEFGLAVNRLANARLYNQTGEYGAARYELRQLRRILER